MGELQSVIVFCCLISICTLCDAFIIHTNPTGAAPLRYSAKRSSTYHGISCSDNNNNNIEIHTMPDSVPESLHTSQKKNINRSSSVALQTLSLILTASTITASSKQVNAKTYFDTDVYGDKELKIATVNKIKQKLRNAILNDNSIAPGFLELSINDALGFDITSQDGGADGSIQFEMDRETNSGLKPALEILKAIKKELQRTTSVSFSDICMFAGGEALETVGCGRITIQVGRFDAKKENKKASQVPWNALADGGEYSSSSVLDAFMESGFDIRETVLLLGALGEVKRVTAEAIKTKEETKATEEDDEEFEPTPFVPSTFGARDNIYGAKMGKGDFSTKYLQSVMKNKIEPKDGVGRLLADTAKMKTFIQKYATNEVAFKQDVAEVYLKLGNIGKEFTTRNS